MENPSGKPGTKERCQAAFKRDLFSGQRKPFGGQGGRLSQRNLSSVKDWRQIWRHTPDRERWEKGSAQEATALPRCAAFLHCLGMKCVCLCGKNSYADVMSLYWIVPTVPEESRVLVRTDHATMPTSYWALISDPTSPEREPGKRHVPENQGLGHCLDSIQARVAEKHPELISQCMTRDLSQGRLCSSIEKYSERYKQNHHSISEGITALSGITLQAQWETFWWGIRKATLLL